MRQTTFTLYEAVVPLGLLLLVGCMLIPIPSWMLDILLCANLLFAVLLVIGTLHIREPLKLTTLPSLLLLATLVRLSLNLATTRAVLGTGHAGKAVEAFGSIVIQGNFVVGFVLFLLITLIQFIVVAKGAERVAEVSARFTLDALPGKQMAIDAEIRGGLLDPEAARTKRQEVQTESRFYGALDGAMKFVKGDAIAGLVITFVNIVGGLLVGVIIQHLDFDVAIKRYTLLTIGDGLLSQIPSLLNSVAAGLVVTRVQSHDSSSLSSDLLSQLGEFKAARVFVALASFVLGCLPGMPHGALFAVAGLSGVSLMAARRDDDKEEDTTKGKLFEPTLSLTVQIEVSKDFIPSLPSLRELSDNLEELRSYAFGRWGIVLQRPGISVWDRAPTSCRLLIRGMEVWRSGDAPAWHRVLTHLQDAIDEHRGNLIDDGATRRALDYVELQIPDLVSGVVPSVVSLTQLTGLLRSLLKEGVTTRHLDVVLQTIAEHGGKCSERALLAEVRAALAPVISEGAARDNVIQGIAIEPLLDLALSKAEETGSLLAGDVVDAICSRVGALLRPEVVLVASKRARAYLRDVVRIRWADVRVIAYEEVAPRYNVVSVGHVELEGESLRAALLQGAM